LVTFGLETNFNTHAIRSKIPKESRKKSKRGPAKKEGPSIKEKTEMRYGKVLDDLLVNQEKLTKTQRVNLSNYIFPKTKSVRDKFTLEKLKRKKKISLTRIQILPSNFLI
jgi:hypothetical protein